MRHLHLLLLLAPALGLVAATCVTDVRQRGSAGPWAVDVVNTGDQPVTGTLVQAQISDATGRALGFSNALTCPSTIPPHGKAAAEVFLFATPGGGISRYQPMILPLRATVRTMRPLGAPPARTGDGLAARVTETLRDGRYAMVQVENTSAAPLPDVDVCATLRGPSGELLEVGFTPLFPTTLAPGATQTVPIFFDEMPNGVVDVFPSAATGSVQAVGIDPSEFRAETTLITGTGSGRVLHVAGEMTNTSGQDLEDVRMLGFVEGAPAKRVLGGVACGTGVVGRGTKTPVTFAIPVPADVAQPRLVVLGIEGKPSAMLTPLPVRDVTVAPLGSLGEGVSAAGVTATVSDPLASRVVTRGECATIRDASSRTVGGAWLINPNGLRVIEAGQSVRLSNIAPILARAASADVVVYGEEQFRPAPVILPVY